MRQCVHSRHRGGPLLALTLLLGLVAGALPAAAQEAGDDEVELLLIMDASASMLEADVDDGPRIDAARAALTEVVDGLPDDIPVGLRVFGAGEDLSDEAVGCTDTELVMPIGPLDRAAMAGAIDGFDPKGFTPIAESLGQAAGDFEADGSRTIVLVSDGIDTCGPPSPCDVAEDLVADGIDVTVQTVGFAIDDEPDAAADLQCIAEATGGDYREAADTAELSAALTALAARAAQRYESDAEPVEGAAIYRDAPVLELETSYTDTVVPGEARWYAYELAEGQALNRVEAIHPGGGQDGGGGTADVVLHFQDGTSAPQTRRFIREGATPTVESVTSYSDLDGPGTFYVEVADNTLEPGQELVYELMVLADGEPVEPTPTPEPTDEPEDDPGSTEAAVADDEDSAEFAAATSDDGGSDLWMFAAGVLFAAVLGLAVALVVVLRRGARAA